MTNTKSELEPPLKDKAANLQLFQDLVMRRITGQIRDSAAEYLTAVLIVMIRKAFQKPKEGNVIL